MDRNAGDMPKGYVTSDYCAQAVLAEQDLRKRAERQRDDAQQALADVVDSYEANGSTRKDDWLTEWQKDAYARARIAALPGEES